MTWGSENSTGNGGVTGFLNRNSLKRKMVVTHGRIFEYEEMQFWKRVSMSM